MHALVADWIARSIGSFGATWVSVDVAILEAGNASVGALVAIDRLSSPYPDRSGLSLDRSPNSLPPTRMPTFPHHWADDVVVEFSLCVDADGVVRRSNMLTGSGSDWVDRSLVRWPYQLSFAPAMVGRTAVSVCGHRLQLELQLKRP